LGEQVQSSLRQKNSIISQLYEVFESQHPKHKNKRGFVQVTRDSKVVDLDELCIGDEFEAMNDHRSVRSKVVSITSM
jgi:exodeoxyribonuclease VII large subunit